MIARLKYAKDLFSAGLLELRGLLMGGLDIASKLSVLAALAPDMMPEALRPYHPWFVKVGIWALGVSFIAGLFVMQSKRAIPKLPVTGAPSLMDDETGQ